MVNVVKDPDRPTRADLARVREIYLRREREAVRQVQAARHFKLMYRQMRDKYDAWHTVELNRVWDTVELFFNLPEG